MAVVESAADGLTLTLPALGLPMPADFAHLAAPDHPNFTPSLQLQHEHDRFLLHHHQHYQLHHQLPLQQSLENTLHFAVDHAPSPPQHGAIARSTAANTEMSVKSINTEPLVLLTDGGKILTVDGSNGNGALDGMHQTSNPINAPPLRDTKSSSPANGAPLHGSSTNADPSKLSSANNMRELEDLLSKLNPLAEEFVPSGFNVSDAAKDNNRKKKNDIIQGKRKANGRVSKAQREECIKRTVYVSDIDQQVTEEQLAALFLTCGPVVDCRVCGDPNSLLRFAFVEFTDENGARAALSLAGTILGYYPVRVLPSKTAIVPVNPTFLPRSEDEREMCSRTVYCTNIDKKVQQADVKLFFESLCGEVARLRLLGDYRHSTRIAFVEFVRAESAIAALNCSGAILGSLPLRVSPSKTPVRPRSPRLLH